eukprot:CAMPEP_0177577228 /NCGR_PEP_ID=MMETSP0369-20130122/80531_1 /TAXON_ID=447022 ORGANISM="Scrippsiella hangoei-like, Strain SHHI-4" /NCGR_SAMPLE_ID=MMETSP0369 /ASSEMBLY_ACC=CAM_ASM_000364 /LENGTH=262 /DNA_ID=CAMNT_0019065557 /DNA_START=44 /DNA_END=829 /DNA_ORIENTATION=+
MRIRIRPRYTHVVPTPTNDDGCWTQVKCDGWSAPCVSSSPPREGSWRCASNTCLTRSELAQATTKSELAQARRLHRQRKGGQTPEVDLVWSHVRWDAGVIQARIEGLMKADSSKHDDAAFRQVSIFTGRPSPPGPAHCAGAAVAALPQSSQHCSLAVAWYVSSSRNACGEPTPAATQEFTDIAGAGTVDITAAFLCNGVDGPCGKAGDGAPRDGGCTAGGGGKEAVTEGRETCGACSGKAPGQQPSCASQWPWRLLPSTGPR